MDAREAGELLRLAMIQKSRPVAASSRMNDLVQRYLEEDSFRRLVDSVAEGLGLEILDTSRSQFLLTPSDEESPFALNLSEYSRILGGKAVGRSRLVAIHLGLAASFFPTAAALDSDFSEVGHWTEQQLRDRLRDMAQKLANHESADSVDQFIWADLLSMEIAKESERFALTTLEGIIGKVLKDMVDNRLLSSEKAYDGIRYMPTRAYRLLIRRRAGRLLAKVLDLMKDQESLKQKNEESIK